MANPVQVTCSVSPCTVQLSFNDPVFAMDSQDAGLVAAAVVGLWAVGYGFRVLIRAMNVDRKEDASRSDD